MKMNSLNIIARLVLIISFLLSGPGCNKRDPNPEIRDPIYQDLVELSKNLDKQIKEKKKFIEEQDKVIENSAPGSKEKAVASRDRLRAKKRLEDLEQEARYYKIRAERRRVEGRKAYRLLYEKGEADKWPDLKEYEAFKANINLRQASRNWNQRVPKLKDRIPSESEESSDE